MTTTIYTDGACSGNPGPGGWAWAIPNGAYGSGAEKYTTNQRMEITAVLEGLRANEGPIEVVSDSTYVINCFRDKWWEGWLKRNWQTSAKKPVANKDLWEPLIELVRSREVSFRWVKGHSGDPMNDLVDQLAVQAGKAQKGAQGVDSQVSENAVPAGGEAPAGHLLLVTGHRPPELGGYDPNPTADGVRKQLKEIIDAKAQMFDDLVVVSGMSLGAEQLGVEAASEAGVPYAAVLAYPEQEAKWPTASRDHYAKLLAAASGTVVLQSKEPGTKQAAGAALDRRNAWLARNAQEAIVVWNGQDPFIGRQIRSLQDHLGETEVWVLTPV